ncbi:MAG: hypothetical protein ISR65_02775 [Bacteriovoracaceae bacterium]|nr:hypothetical protein [Bacteriovoracaceae bacterium]
MKLSKSATSEDRAIVKFPTSEEEDTEDCLDFDNFCSIFFLPLVIIASIFDCDNDIVTSANLQWSHLILNTSDESTIAAGNLRINTLAKPWFYTANWDRAHPFSAASAWDSAGGDIDTAYSFNTNCNLTAGDPCASDEVRFDVTDYFKVFMDNPERVAHYGLLIAPVNNFSSVNLKSVQFGGAKAPRIESLYTGTCNNSKTAIHKKSVYYLGTPVK